MSLLKTSEVANILRVTPETVRRLIREGKINTTRISSGQHRTTMEDIANYLQLKGNNNATSND
jgi:excisionase family DNA binding protein